MKIVEKFKSKEFLRFFISGSVAFLVDFIILNLLIVIFKNNNGSLSFFNTQITDNTYILSLPIFIPNAISTIFGIITTYSLNKYWAFKSKTNNIVKEGGRFALVLLLNYLLNNVFFGLIRENSAISEQIIKIIVTAMQMFWTFLLYKFFVFRKY